MIVNLDGCEKECLFTCYTLTLYEQEFNSDLIADLFGKATTEPELTSQYFDYTKRKWSATPKALWAGLKAADDNVPAYSTWAKGTAKLNLFEIWAQIANEVQESFFWFGADSSEKEKN